MNDSPEIDRSLYRQMAKEFWRQLDLADPEAANRETDAGDVLVNRWRALGRLEELLEQLLLDRDPEVRFAAASDLSNDGNAKAVEVLEELALDPKGLIAPTAKLKLMTLRNKGKYA